MFEDRVFWDIALSNILVWSLILVILFTLSTGGNIVEIACYCYLSSFPSVLVLFRVLVKE